MIALDFLNLVKKCQFKPEIVCLSEEDFVLLSKNRKKLIDIIFFDKDTKILKEYKE